MSGGQRASPPRHSRDRRLRWRMARELGLSVKFWGWLDNKSPELKQLFERSAIFVFTSEAENFPVVLLEAMAAGQAIVTCDDTGCPEVVGADAQLVPPRRPDRLREALRCLVEDDQLRAQGPQEALGW